MELIKAVKFDAEFLEYFYNALIAVIPSVTLEGTRIQHIQTIDKIIRAMLIKDKWTLERCNADWVVVLEMAVKHYQAEGETPK